MTAQSTSQHGPEPEPGSSEEPDLSLLEFEDPVDADDPDRSHVDLTPAGESRGWRYYLRAVGPGLVTGASDDDPSGIATYSQAGASQGFGRCGRRG